MLKILLILGILALLALPFLPIRLPFTLCGYNFPEDKRHKNVIYIASTLVIALATVVLMPLILDLAEWFGKLKLVAWILSKIPNYARYGAAVAKAIFANVLFVAVILLMHALGGTLGGLFRLLPGKEGRQSAWEERKKAWAAARAARKKARQEKKNKKNDEPQPQKEQEKAEEEPIAPHLLPKPEKNDNSGKIRVMGKEQKITRAAQAVKTGEGNERKTRENPGDEQGGISWKKLVDLVVGLFYEKRSDGWYVQPQCKKVAQHLRNFLILAGVLYLVIFALLLIPVLFPVKTFAQQYYGIMDAMVDNCYLYPAISLVLLTELFWFMNGRLPEEPAKQLPEEWSRQNGRIVDLDLLERELMKVFGKDHQVRFFHTDDISVAEQVRNPVDLSQEPVLQSVVNYAQEQGLARNDDYLRGIQALQRGKHVLFDAPLYTSAGIYLYPYLNMRVSQGERLVVVCQDPTQIPQVVNSLKQGFQSVLHTHTCVWQIVSRSDLRVEEEPDVLVLTPEDFRDDRLLEDLERFFSRTTMVLLPDADRVVMANNYNCLVMAERLRQYAANPVQYVFLSTRHTLNLAGSLTEYFRLDQTVHTAQAEYAYGSLRLYVWKTGGESATLLDNSSQRVRMETAIATVAAQNGIANINLVSDGAIFPDQINTRWLDAYDTSDRPIGFTVVADDRGNLPGTIYAYSRYTGKQASVLHVISKPYLLRDYFFDRAAQSIYERPLMEQGIAEHGNLRRSGTILLLCRLMQGMPVEQFAAEMERITGTECGELTFPRLQKLVDGCLQIAFGEEAWEHQGFVLYEKTDDRFVRSRYIQIRESGVLDRLLADTQLVTIKFRGDRPDARLNLFKKMLDQRFVEGQHLVFDNTNFHITHIDRERGIIEVDDATVVRNIPDEYVQARRYTLKDTDPFDKARKAVTEGSALEDPRHFSGVSIRLSSDNPVKRLVMVRSADGVQIESNTLCYHGIHSSRFLANTKEPAVVSFTLSGEQRERLRRSVGDALYLKLEGEFLRSDRLTMTLAVVLQEMMKTLFPDQHFCVSVCPILEDPDAIYNSSDASSRLIAGIYPRLEGWKATEKSSVELLIVDDCQGGTGVLDMLCAPEGVYLQNILDMMSDYMKWLRDNEEGSYLYFGGEECPAIFDLNGLRELLATFSRSYVREDELFRRLHVGGCCEFCGRSLHTEQTYLWNNSKNICVHCKDAYIPNGEEAEKILAYGLKFLKDTFGVTLPEGLSTQIAPGKDISTLDVEAGVIYLAQELPLTTVHSELMKQLVRLWQLHNLRMTGEPEFEGQVLYVLLQYLQYLEQHQLRKRLHRRALLESDDPSVGYCKLRQALQSQDSDNSFRYMLEQFPVGSKPTVRKVNPRRSVRSQEEGKVRYHFYEQLSPKCRQAYDRALQAVATRAESFRVGDLELTEKEMDLVWSAMNGDHPEHFWLHRWGPNAWTTTNGYVDQWKPFYYRMSEEEIQRRQAEVDASVERFMEGITPETGDYAAALLLYERMAEELDYDSLELERFNRSMAQQQKTGHYDNTPDHIHSLYGALVDKKAVCAGYAMAMQYMLQKLGIETMYVCGDCQGEGRHAWVIANLEGDYYHIDVTWGDNSNTDPAKRGEGINYKYFGLTDQDIAITRTTDKEPAVPVCRAVSCNYFIREGLYFEAYDQQAVKSRLVELVSDPERMRLDLRFANAQVFRAAFRYLHENGGIYEVLRSAQRSNTVVTYQDERYNVLTFMLS